MRVLLTGLPIPSHVLPTMVPIALALRRAGHEVAIATGGAVAAAVERHGVPVLVLPDVLAPHEVRPEMLPGFSVEQVRRWRPEVSGPLSVPLFVGGLTSAFAANLLEVAARWQPHVIVRETNEYGGYLAAAVLGVPLAVVDVAPLTVRLIPELTDGLNVLREELGLPAVESFVHASGQLAAGLLPERWYPDELRTPGHRYYRAPDTVDGIGGVGGVGGAGMATGASEVGAGSGVGADGGPPLGLAVPERPEGGPVVLATFGSNVHSLLATGSELMSITVAALGALPVRAVVALGSEQAVASWSRPLPANVRLAAFVPQRQLLGVTDVFLTHAGYSGIREALAVGVPMVALPLFSEQPANAVRVAELGLGVHLDPAGLGPDSLAAGIARVLDEPAHRSAALSFQRDILALPALTSFVDDLVALAGGGAG